MSKTAKIYIALLAFVFSAASIFIVLIGLDDFDIDKREQIEIEFQTETAILSGTLLLPPKKKSAPIVILVHGDGPQDRYSSSGYLPLINALIDNGIGVYSWDKAGVHKSTGNWLDQSMADRASETLAAYKAVRAATNSFTNRIGFLGFSQAGWVLPKLSGKVTPDTFLVMIGAATNWRSQGVYYTKIRLAAEGRTKQYIEKYVSNQIKNNDALFTPPVNYEKYLEQTNDTSPMSKDRFQFVALNYWSDSGDDLKKLDHPTLIMLGSQDLNVDAKTEAEYFTQNLLGNNRKNKVTLLPNATHSLLDAHLFNHQLSNHWPLHTKILFAIMGRQAYTDDAIHTISDWIHNVSAKDAE